MRVALLQNLELMQWRTISQLIIHLMFEYSFLVIFLVLNHNY